MLYNVKNVTVHWDTFKLNDKDGVKNDEKIALQIHVHKIMVSYSKLCTSHFSVNISQPACVDREQNKVLAVICIERR